MIAFRQWGDFLKTKKFLKAAKQTGELCWLNEYGEKGVAALKKATPVDTGRTAASWYYIVEQTPRGITLSFCNDNIQNGTLVAVAIQYGHATVNGTWVDGRDYINPAIRPVFNEIAERIQKEAKKQ